MGGRGQMDQIQFQDRRAAGRALARKVARYRALPGLLVLALPRGGVPVAFEVARELGAPLDIFLVRKLGVPGHEELAMGAIATGDVLVLNPDVVAGLRIPEPVIHAAAMRETEELQRREREYRGHAPPPDLQDRTVILVDDGLATGSTMRAAVQAVRAQSPRRIIVAVPVGAESTCAALAREADEVVCAATPEPFLAVGYWYQEFMQTTDEEVRHLLAVSREPQRLAA